MDWLCSSLVALLLRLEAIDVDVIIVHREELLQDIDSTILLLARSTWSCSRAATKLLVGAISRCMAGLVALEA